MPSGTKNPVKSAALAYEFTVTGTILPSCVKSAKRQKTQSGMTKLARDVVPRLEFAGIGISRRDSAKAARQITMPSGVKNRVKSAGLR